MSGVILKKIQQAVLAQNLLYFFRMIVRSTKTEKIIDFLGYTALIGNTEVQR